VGGGNVARGYLGVKIETIPSDVASQLNSVAGVALTQVMGGSPAAKAGLQAATGSQIVNGQSYPTGGDVITAVDGHSVSSSDTLQNEIAGKKPGAKVKLTVVSGGDTKQITVTLGTRPS
jgi:serine protease Do